MSGSVNKVVLLGNMAADPEVRFTPSGGAVANFRMATNETFKDKQGQKQTKTEWHRITVWGKLAELCGEYLKKGAQAYVEGKIQTRKWQDKDGKDQYSTEIIAHEVVFLGGKQGGGGGNRAEPSTGGHTPDDSDIPF